MNIKYVISAAAGILAAAAVNVHGQSPLPSEAVKSNNNNATQPYGQTAIQPQIRLNLENDTDKVHFVRNNTDPYVVTKVYEVKHADIYELRPLIISAVRSKKITQDNTYVEAIRYNNGTRFLIISAEADRFGRQENGQGIDEIVKTLDQPKIINSSGIVRYVYFPKYRSAEQLRELVWNVGSVHQYDGSRPIYNMDSFYELQQGQDQVLVEPSLNALFLAIPGWSKKSIDAMLQYYDQPILQAEIKFTIYEIYAENDGRIGADFQSWKNNDGVDLLSAGGRYRSNWASTWAGGIDQNGSNKTQFFNFNPKWNSKYLDFLVSKGKAKVRNSGNVLVKNNETATINASTRVFYDQYVSNSDKTLAQYVTAPSGSRVYGTKPVAPVLNDYYFSANNNGETIKFAAPATTATSVSAVKISAGGVARYQLASIGADFYSPSDLGLQTTADNFTLYKYVGVYNPVTGANDPTWVAQPWIDDINVAKGPTINTLPSGAFGYVLTIKPQICQDSTNLFVNITNSSLIGWKSNGDPRIATGDTIYTEIMIANKGNRFVIGGINKETVVRSVTGVPFLRELPGLGWLFSTESESTKKSQLVVAAEVNTRSIYAQLTEAVSDSIKKINKGTENASEKIKWGYDQYLIDRKL
jgi:type II secretory pathway component GspD/PulD (secretin)